MESALMEVQTGKKLMIESEETKNQPRSMQISMSYDVQVLLKILAALTGSTAAAIVQSLLEPYINFTVKILQTIGLADEFGVLMVKPSIAMKIIKNNRRDPSYAKLIKKEMEENGLTFPFYQPRKL